VSVRDGKRDEPRRWRGWAALGVVIVLGLTIVVFAVRAPGFHAAQVNLDDAGVWVANGDRGLIGRINTEIGKLEVAVTTPGSFEIAQTDDTVAVDRTDTHELAVVDVRNAELGRPTKVPDNASTSIGGSTTALSDAATGKVWVTERNRTAQLDPAGTPTLEAGPGTRSAVGVDGTAYSYADGALDVLAVRPGREMERIPVPFGLRDAEVSAVGDQPVVLEPASGRLILPGGRIAELGRDRRPRLQLPGAAHDDVLVATDDALVAVDLAEGTPRNLSTAGTGSAVPPVWLDALPGTGSVANGRGCAYGAWAQQPSWVQICPGQADRGGPVKARSGATLRLRVNRHRAALNDARSGFTLLFTDGDPIEVDNWREVLPPDQGPQPEERIVQKPQDECDTTRFDAEVNPDERGTRAGRAVFVPVLDNDRFPSCQVPVVSVPDPPRHEVADVAVVKEGTALQVTPAPDRVDPVQFSYTVSLGSRTFSAAVRVAIIDRTRNSPPKTATDTTTVVAGRTVRHNVLTNDFDPDGDTLTVIEARMSAGEGTPSFQTDGEISYTAPGGITGEQTVTYTAADELGATATGILKIVVTREGVNVAPTARNDRKEVVVGRRERIDLLANDSDPNGDPLTISGLTGEPPDLDVRREGTTAISVSARRPGPYTFAYTVSDGEADTRGWVRVDAVAPTGNRPPVAVRDELAARPGVPAFYDLTANDTDPDGDLLSVRSVATTPNLSIVVLDLHIVRVTAPAGFSGPVDVRYTVTDGQADSDGVLVVRPYDLARVDQAPVVGDDEVSVRAGNVTTARVLANDVDPEGERLTLVRVDGVPTELGAVFIEDDELRVQAAPGPARTLRVSYTVTDPGGNRADGRLTVRVTPADQTNQPPVAPLLEARVFAGSEITIPLAVGGLDPDGDVVTVVGLSERDGEQPVKGHARIVPEGFRYRADRGAAGTDGFGFVVRDAGGLEATGFVRVAVVPRPTTNSPPVAVPDHVTVRIGTSVPIAVLDNDTDPDGDPLALLMEGKDAPTQPRGGHVTAAPDGSPALILTVDPAAPAGDVSFAYTAADGRGGSSRGIVTVTITVTDPADMPPVARDDVAPPQKPGATVDVDVLANDRDPDGATERLGVTVVAVPTGVTAEVLPDGKLRVHVGDRSVSLVYAVTDAGGSVARAVVSIPVMDNRPPVCELGSAEVRAGDDVSVDVRGLCRDPDGQGIAVLRVLDATRGGTARLDGDRVMFTAAPEVPGDAGFEVLVTDGSATAVVGVVVRVTGRNWPPALASSAIELPAGGERAVDLNTLVTDLNAEDRHTFSNLSGSTPQINATLAGSVLHVQAGDGARGATALLSVTVSDGPNQVTGQLEVRVLRHDGQPPIAVDDAARTYQERPVPIDVVANDVDPLGKGLTVLDVSTTNGSAAIAGPSIIFTPAAGFFGEALLTYRVTDASRDVERASAATVRVAVIGRPSRPPAPAGIADNRTVHLTWGAAQPNGAPIDAYVVEAEGVGTRQSGSTSFDFGGLTNGASYRFRVAAHNEAVERIDQLAFSEWSAPVVPDTKPGTPAPPKLVFGNGSVHVSWAPPANEGTPIRNYQVRVAGGGAKDLGLALETTWDGLTNGTKYDFSVRAENGSGFGEWSSPSNDPVNGVPAAPPGQVPNVAAVRLDGEIARGGLVRVTWGAPADNGDGAFTFEVTVSPPDTPPITINDLGARSTDIGGLQFGKPYTFSVRARNKAGFGPPGTSTVVPAARPSAPGMPTAGEGDRSVTLSLGAPDDHGAPISRWEVSTNNGAFVAVIGPPAAGAGSQVSLAVGGLANGTAYSFRVRACNEVGCGEPSPPSNTVTPFGNPDAPTVTAAVDGATITWTWTIPSGNGRPIVRYDLALDNAALPATGATTYSQAFPQGGAHTLRVTAVSAGNRTATGSSTATAVPPPVPVVTTAGAPKDTYDGYSPLRGPHLSEVPADATVLVSCRVAVPVVGGTRWWYNLVDFGGHWIAGDNLTVPADDRVRTC
jgi:hypothetical protein